MKIFRSESKLLSELEKYDRLILNCASERITFSDFLSRYNNFYFVYALDGHESDDEEQMLFKSYESRIAVHRELSNVFSNLCSDEDAQKDEYIRAGRFGSKEALRRLKEISKKYLLSN